MDKDEYTAKLEEIMAKHKEYCFGMASEAEFMYQTECHLTTNEAVAAIKQLNNEAIGEDEPLHIQPDFGKIRSKIFNALRVFDLSPDDINPISKKKFWLDCEQAITELIVKQVKEARAEVLNLYGTPICENLHHSKSNRHSGFEDCPVVARVLELKKRR